MYPPCFAMPSCRVCLPVLSIVTTGSFCVPTARCRLKRKGHIKRLFAYQMAMALARSMRSKGLISAKEYAKIDTIIAEKYGISSCSIFR